MRTHEKVLARIESDLAAGRWALGERLPAERALAEELQVSRPSVREAIRILEAMGMIRTAVGSGPDAGATVIDRPAAGLGAAVRLHVASGTLPVHDVVATRATLETWAVREAAARSGDTDDGWAAEATRLLEAMEVPGLGVDEFVRLDQDFHLVLVRLAGNQLVEAILAGLRSAVASYVARGVQQLPAWPATADRLCGEHREILDAVVAGDVDRAERETREHIWGFYRETGLAGDASAS
ncbi:MULTISPECIES: FadR/GntR family transcriptional regulator [unclassified Isoptericola]|uniref:FadR/GntR family transcriptional regulator n=1 Tax=unclassified Isoptericola TaxID=2623355 RepID=UPI00271430FC|nr:MULTISPECIES: FCD domain-containing protein [unclassified Isoptericola]MDO8143312.1 FCD domain-containing protein [Isoptericola sp. 178]MDO8147172.1 FCD domain-containing protein [Isoptericola sp. b515]